MMASAGAAEIAGPIVRHEYLDGVMVVTLDQPRSRNGLSLDMIAALTAAFADAAADHTVRAVVLAAAGPAFCSGHDLKELTARRSDPDAGYAFFQNVWAHCAAMMQLIVRLPKPVIACVQGAAAAAGCQLVATCDLAVASSAATFSTPGVNIGLFCSTPMVALSRNVAAKHAMEMLLTGDLVSAAHAERIGLVNRVVPAGTERAEALRLARQIASKSPAAIAAGKRAFYAQREMSLSDAYDYASRIMVENMLDPDAAEGIGAFLAKRPPHWR